MFIIIIIFIIFFKQQFDVFWFIENWWLKTKNKK